MPSPQYRERIFGLTNRRLALSPESVHITGTAIGMRIDVEIDLKDLSPKSRRVWARTMHFRWASLALLLIGVPFIILLLVAPPVFIVYVVGGIGFCASLLYFLTSLRRIEVRSFMNRSGVIAFDIWRSGPDEDHFAEFVQAVESRISHHSDTPARPLL
jgi:hypothetical protein